MCNKHSSDLTFIKLEHTLRNKNANELLHYTFMVWLFQANKEFENRHFSRKYSIYHQNERMVNCLQNHTPFHTHIEKIRGI